MSNSSAVSRTNYNYTNINLPTGSNEAIRQPNALESDGLALSCSAVVAVGSDDGSFDEANTIDIQVNSLQS